MNVVVEFNKSAFQHGISKEDIIIAFKTKIKDAIIEELPEKYGVIGFDRAGNPLEIIYYPIDDNTIYVFHAMKARNSFIKLLDL
ncbi:MAG: hypothetical protein FWG77_01405 [Treponema sp.]|nr:hypothetical protein [Treponema sp.]